MRKKQYTDSQFIEAVKTSFSYAEVCRKIGLAPLGGNLTTVKLKISRLHLDSSHFTGSKWNKGKVAGSHKSIKCTPLENILVEKSGWTSNSIRNRLLQDGKKEYKCELCGLTEWLGKPIPLELHHKNHDHFDNRLENLQMLCCNCHRLTHRKDRCRNTNLNDEKEMSKGENNSNTEDTSMNSGCD